MWRERKSKEDIDAKEEIMEEPHENPTPPTSFPERFSALSSAEKSPGNRTWWRRSRLEEAEAVYKEAGDDDFDQNR